MSSKEIRRLRKTLGLSQAELAAIVGTRQHVISYWETGKHKPKGSYLEALVELRKKVRNKFKARRWHMAVERIPLSEIKGALCAWNGCGETFEGDELPLGWRCLVVASGSLFEFKNLMNADRDGVLCPAHVKQLGILLKGKG